MPWLADPLDWLGKHAGISITQVQDWLVAAGKHVLQFLASSGGTFVLGALGTLVSFLLMLFVLFFVLRDGPALAQKVVRMLPIEERMRGKLWQHLREVTRAVFMGIGVTALVQGALVGVGFWIAGLPSALVFGVLARALRAGTARRHRDRLGARRTLPREPGRLRACDFPDAVGHVRRRHGGQFPAPAADLRPRRGADAGGLHRRHGRPAAFGFIGLFVGPIVLGLLVALFRFQSDAADGTSGAG